jgi:2,3-bisphosphoglycerate-dependent phosphoglycerate mutase
VKTLILARHGESEYSARGLCNGDPSIPVGLTERGREEAARLGRELAATQIDLCVTSQFPRTEETAGIALAGRDVPRIILPELDDLDYGEMEGDTRDQYHAWQRQHGRLARLPGGESRIALAHRAATGLGILLDREEQTVLAVTHEIIIEVVLNAADDVDPAERRRIEYATPYQLPAELVRAAVARLAAWHPDAGPS